MTIPYIPGWGDDLAQSLPALGLAIRDILMPNKQYEVALRQALANDPTLAGKLATIEKDNPGAIGQIYGKNAGQFAQGLRETPQARLQRQITSSASGVAANRMDDVGAAALGIDDSLTREGKQLNNQGQQIRNEGGQVALDREKLFSRIFNSLPAELQNDAVFVQHFGVPQVEYEKIQRRAKNMKSSEHLMELGANELMTGFVRGKYSTDQIQGWIDNNPDSSKAIMDLFALDKEARLRRDLAKSDRRDFMQLAYIETVKDARKLGVNPAALFKYQTGVDASEAVPEFAGKPVSPEEVKQAEEAYVRFNNAERSRALKPVNIALGAFEKDPSVGAAAALTAAFQSADIPIEAVWKDGWIFNEREYYMTLDSGERIKVTSDQVQDIIKSGGELPGADTKTGDGGTPSRGTSTTTKAPTFNEGKYTKLSPAARKTADAIRAKGYDRETVARSQAYQQLSPEDKANLTATFGWDNE